MNEVEKYYVRPVPEFMVNYWISSYPVGVMGWAFYGGVMKSGVISGAGRGGSVLLV